MQGRYKIAGHSVQINSQVRAVQEQCRAYQTDEEPEYIIEPTKGDICHEKAVSRAEQEKENLPFCSFPDSDYESLAVYRKLTEKLFIHDILLCHGSVVAVDDFAYMFIAKSGTGKSTHTRMWRELLGDRAIMVNDDKPLIHVGKEGVMVYGTPWNGKHHLGNNIAVPLKAICLLNRGEENRIEKIGFIQAYPALLQQIYKIQGKESWQKLLRLMDDMGNQVDFYTMDCTISREAARMAYDTMKGKKKE